MAILRPFDFRSPPIPPLRTMRAWGPRVGRPAYAGSLKIEISSKWPIFSSALTCAKVSSGHFSESQLFEFERSKTDSSFFWT
ncbi:MAG: hypothetical protein A3E80_00070 [Chlamydiae bacterium RIFCSPHIGHO2_12_FULL_49_9]|nr:MAG: hypothetical protein A3E80_00070 [Chlamydiae bacterium RIFCSPHIGHO2_12_FULL_49_9]